MKNNKGFVMIETIIVISVLAVGLISLYSSYSLILSKTTTKSSYDNAEYIYKSYFITKMISSDEDNINYITLKDSSNNNVPYKVLYDNTLKNGVLFSKYNALLNLYNVDKIYLTPMNLTYITDNLLLEFDGSTIGYLKSINDNEVLDNTNNRIIIKYKFGKGETEFSSLPITKVV